jgi:mono/diheme cytochrome c family protein
MTALLAGAIRSKAALAFTLAALAGPATPSAVAEPEKPAGAPLGGTVTFNKDIAPLLFERCAGCHRPGEVAPFSLLSYRDASKRAKLIRSVISERVMPPWKGDPGVGHFVDERRLTDAQVALITRWVDGGAPEGEPADLPAAPNFTAGWQLGEPDMLVTMPEPYSLVAEGRDDYRCFVIPLEIPAGKYISAVEYRPGNRRIVHHAVLTSLPHQAAQAKLATGDGKSFGSGLAPPGQLLPGPLGIWTPGKQPRPLPEGYAAAWPGGADLVLQLHLHPSGKPETEQSSIGFHFTDQKPRGRVRMVMVSNNRVDIPAGASSHAIEASTTLKQPVDIFGIFPHMHLIGRTVRLTATLPDGSTEPLLSIGDWDFNWQNYYQYASPVHLPAGTKIEGRWTYDNSEANPANPSSPPKRVTFGEQTSNEMAIAILDIIPAPGAPEPGQTTRAMTADDMMSRAVEVIRKADKDGDGRLALDEMIAFASGHLSPEELQKKLDQFDSDGDKRLNPAELVEVLKSLRP